MDLPKPEEMRSVVAAADELVRAVVDRMVKIAEEYQVQGEPVQLDGSIFKVYKSGDRWDVFHCGYASITPVTEERLEEKVSFLKEAAKFEKAYHDQIVAVYGDLRKLTKSK